MLPRFIQIKDLLLGDEIILDSTPVRFKEEKIYFTWAKVNHFVTVQDNAYLQLTCEVLSHHADEAVFGKTYQDKTIFANPKTHILLLRRKENQP